MFEGQLVTLTVRATDADHDSLSYSLFKAPAGMTITDSVISWMPTFSQSGIDTVIVRVIEHPSLLFMADTFIITVIDVGTAETYVEVADSVGLDDGGVTNALAWADFNNDSLADVYVANAGSAGRLYRATSGGASFVQATGFSGASVTDATSAAWADYNHDGRIDLYVGSSGLFGGSANRLYRNDSANVFTDVTSATGTGDTGMSQSVSWVDFDRDGDPDIYVVNYGGANRLYSNNNNGTFTETADSVGLADPGNGVAAAWCDFDGDGRPDLYLVNENSANKLFKNNGDSTFTDVTTTAGVGHTGSGSAAAWGDYDNDGDFDLFLANKDSLQVLYSNNGNSTFTRLGTSAGLSVRGTARSASWLDFDMNGLLDLMVTFSDSASKLFQNMGDSTFINVASLQDMNRFGYFTSVTWADPANQGVPDVYLGRRNGANLYYDGRVGGSYLKLRLHGVVSNRFGLGAKVRIKAGGKAYLRWVDGGTGSQSEPAALFGLGTATSIDSLTVFWPAGLRRDTTNLAVNRVFTWYETDSLFPVVDSTTIYPDTTLVTAPYTITTFATDNNSFTPRLWYSKDRGKSYTPVTMTSVGSNKYSGNIPVQISGTRLQYYVSAVDSLGHTTRQPRAAPDSFYMFSADDSVPTIVSVSTLTDTAETTSPYGVTVRAKDDDSLRTVYLVRAYYRQGVLDSRDSVAMTYASQDSTGFQFTGQIPAKPVGTLVKYYIRAVDLAKNYRRSPTTTADSTITFRVVQFSGRTVNDNIPVGKGQGISVTDYDLDGRLDIFIANSDTLDVLLRGVAGDSLFAVATGQLGTGGATATAGGVWGDYNNDRYPDLYIVAQGTNRLLKNNGNGTFTNVTTTARVGDAGQGWAAAWVDYDNNGRLDLFVVNSDGPDRLYRNNGDSTFTDTASSAGLAGGTGGVGCAWSDYDRDGDQDVYVVYYGAANKLYRNDGNGHFTDVTSAAGVAGGTTNVSAAWFDYDNDRRPDLFVVEQADDRLYHNNGNGTFTVVNLGADGLSNQPGGFGSAWGDYDNDGWPDLVATRGETGKKDIVAVLRGNGAGGFVNYTYESGLFDFGEWRGTGWLDYNGDGRLDLLLNDRAGRPRLYRNILFNNTNHWLRIKLLGTRSNASAIGAAVTAYYGSSRGFRQIGGGAGLASQSEPVVHFGLGPAASVDSLVLDWPSGIHQVLTQVAANQVLNLIEKDTLYPRIAAYDTIPDQFTSGATPKVTARVIDQDSTTTVRVRYKLSTLDTLITAAMTRDSLRTSGQAFVSYWRYTMPALTTGKTNSWRIVATDPRGATDSTATFIYLVSVDSAGPVIQTVSAPDTVLADTTGPYHFIFRLTDQAGVKTVSLRLSGLTRTGGAVSVQADTTITLGARTLDWNVPVSGYKVGTSFSWYLRAADILGFAAGTDTIRVRVEPRRGKATLGNLPVNVGDLLRLVYIVLGRVPRPTPLDTLGLDLDRDGSLNSEDLDSLLTLWRRAAPSMLTSAETGTQSRPAAAGLEDSGNSVVFNLANQMEVPWLLAELEFTAGEAVPVEVEPGARLKGLVQAGGLTNDGTILVLVLPSSSGGGIPAGNGELFRIRRSQAAGWLPMAEVSLRRVRLGSQDVEIELAAARAGVNLPKAIQLDQNVPNPFNPSTTISYQLPEAGSVTLRVFDTAGRLVTTLMNGRQDAGSHQVTFDGTGLSSGVYLYTVATGSHLASGKMVLLK